jgi:hypothetical protein
MAMEPFGFVAFRSRQQSTAFQMALKTSGITCSIINTPHEIGMGCGLSVKFPLGDSKAVLALCDKQRPTALIGVYRAESVAGRLVCRPISIVAARANC